MFSFFLEKLIKLFRFQLGENVSLERVAEACPLNLTGADFYALCSDALLTSITDYIEKLEQMTGISHLIQTLI